MTAEPATVLVTGATGHVGGRVAHDLVEHGLQVRALVRRPDAALPRGVGPVLGDLADTASLRRACEGAQAVVHSAALLGESGEKSLYWDTNVRGTERALAAAREAGCRVFVFIGSPSAVLSPDGGDQLGVDESAPYPERFFDVYSQTKAAAEQLVLAADAPGFRTCSLRPRAVWGPGDRTGPVMRILRKLRDGRLPNLDRGEPVLESMCYVDHIAQAVRLALTAERAAGKAYFITDAEPVDLWAMIREAAALFQLPPPARRVPAPVLRAVVAAVDVLWRVPEVSRRFEPPLSRYALALLTRSAVYDIAAAKRDLGFRPDVGLDAGLERFQAWVRGQGGLEQILAGKK